MTESKPPRWSRIDEIELWNYPHLQEGDLCFYYRERSAGTWKQGETNQLVSNFQKDVEKYKNRPDVLKYKMKPSGLSHKALDYLLRKSNEEFLLLLCL